jgi:N-acetylglucosaminyldiphosphoundecaprenol N-acetyl-beta-D-mannosaminyltransferase
VAEEAGLAVGFYGSSPEVIAAIVRNVTQRHPRLKLVYSFSPPFRPLTREEDEDVVRQINASGAQILFLGLGCPKQELWMNEHRGRVGATMLGVGWAFDILAGTSQTAPPWIQKIGMEWFYRLLENPRKLWWRHLKNYPRFVVLILLQILGLRRFRGFRAAPGSGPG